MAARIGRYEIQAELGRGGFGRVFRAFDPTVGRMVAIKVLSTGASEPDLLVRFRNEAAAAGKLQHRNIVTIHDFGEQDGSPYIIMEFLEGEDLQRVISGSRRLSVLAKVQIMSQIAQGLQFAHRHGVIHRDVKPANMMVLADGTVKIMDFGIALLTQATGSRLTPTGSVVGTFRYMSPEQFRGSNSDRLSDIFSYGVMYYELMTERHPFDAPEPAGVMFNVVQAEPPPIRQFCPNCPEALQAVVSRLLSKDRELRYQTLEDADLDAGPVLLDLKKAHASELLTQAQGALARDQLEDAQALVREILDLNPADPGARELRNSIQAQIHRRAGRPRVDALCRSGREHLTARRYLEAVRDFESAFRLDADPSVRAAIEQARTALERAQWVDRVLSEARQALDRQDLTNAEHSAIAALQADPDNSRAAALLNSIRHEITHRDRERKLHENLIRAKGSLILKKFDEAIKLLEALQLEFPKSPEIDEVLARARSEKKAHERKARLDAGMHYAKEAVGTDRYADAVAHLESLKEEFPDSPEVHELLASARDKLRAQVRTGTVERITREAIALVEQERYDEALRALHEMLQAYPGERELLGLVERAEAAKWQFLRVHAIGTTLDAANRLRSEGAFPEALNILDRFSEAYGKELEIDRLRLQIETDWRTAQREEGIRKVLGEAHDLMEQGRGDAATRILTQATMQYAGEQEITSMLVAAQQAERGQRRAAAVLRIRERAEAYLEGYHFDDALDALKAGLEAYPGEESLASLQVTAVARRSQYEKEKREQDLSALREISARVVSLRKATLLKTARAVTARYPGDREFEQLLLEISASVERNTALVRAQRRRFALGGALLFLLAAGGLSVYRVSRGGLASVHRVEVQPQSRAVSRRETHAAEQPVSASGVGAAQSAVPGPQPVSKPNAEATKREPSKTGEVVASRPTEPSPRQPYERATAVVRAERPTTNLPTPPVIAPTTTELVPSGLAGSNAKTDQQNVATAKLIGSQPWPTVPPVVTRPQEQSLSGSDRKAAQEANARGQSLYSAKLLDESLINFNEAIRLSPDYAAAFFNRGLVYYQLDELQKAISDLDRALALDPRLQRDVAPIREEAKRRLARGIFRPGKGVSSPVVTNFSRPKYTKEAILSGKLGMVVELRFVVNETGKVEDIRVLRSIAPDVDQRAMNAVKQAKFRPGMKDGKPVAVEMVYNVPFDSP